MAEGERWIERTSRTWLRNLKRFVDSRQIFGWWRFDSEQPAITHETTGQSLRFVRHEQPNPSLSLTESSHRKWMRFDYSDGEFSYPLLVERREAVLRPGQLPSLAWRVDYVRSTLLWTKETGGSSQNPTYGQWHRVDDCITDALAFWPEHSKTGKPPSSIAFNGGWFNGRWETDLYRTVSSGLNPYDRDPSKDPVIDEPSVMPLDTPAPPPWLLGPRSDDRAGEFSTPRKVEPTAIDTFLGEISRTHLHFISSDGKRKLIILPANQETLQESWFGARLLYVDSDIVTDALQAETMGVDGSTSAHWNVRFDRRFPSAIFDPNAPSSILNRKSANFIPWVTAKVGSMYPYTLRCLPFWIDRRLGEACMDVLLSFPGTMLTHVRSNSGARPETEDEPSGTASVSGVAGGGMGSSGITAALSLKEPIGGGPKPLAYMFDERIDEMLLPRATPKEARFWSYDASTQVLSNDGSGQRITFQGTNGSFGKRVSSADTTADSSWCFLYEDRDLQYPLIVERLVNRVASEPRYIWQIDHQRSAQLWRQHGNHDQAFPSYGFWRRVDACATDAFLCWPNSEATGSRPWRVESKSGWLNGVWLPNSRRLCDSGIDYKFEAQPRFYYRNADDELPSGALLDPLDTPCFSWEYVDSREIAKSADLAFIELRESGLPGLAADQRSKHGLSFLPPDRALTGFENAVPSLRRSDGRAVMFPAGLDSDLGPRADGYYPNAYFLYADEDVTFRLKGGSFDGFAPTSLPSSWSFEPDSIFRIALRRPGQFNLSDPEAAPADLFSQYASGNFVSRYPTVPFLRKLTAALTDGWLAWSGTDRRLLDDPVRLAELAKHDPNIPTLEKSGIDLKQKKTVCVEGGYIGGRYSSGNTVTVWIDKN